jgi:ribosomal protein S18 acetylase RimI-like enzyme
VEAITGVRIDIVIEPLREEDVGELLTVQRAAFLRDAQLYRDPFLPSLTQTVEHIRAELSDPNRVYLVAKRGTRLVGSVRAALRNRVGHIGRLMTAPDLEGKGIGGALLSAIETAIRQRVDEFRLVTGKKSTANIGMYERHGYVMVGDSVDGAGIAVVTMSKQAAHVEA